SQALPAAVVRRPEIDSQRHEANASALARMTGAEPVLVDVRTAGEVVPGLAANMVLTSGPPMPWPDYTGGEPNAILNGAVYEGLAPNQRAADQAIQAGEIILDSTHAHGCVGSVAGIYTASMPVFVVHNATNGNTAYCNLYEGESRH